MHPLLLLLSLTACGNDDQLADLEARLAAAEAQLADLKAGDTVPDGLATTAYVDGTAASTLADARAHADAGDAQVYTDAQAYADGVLAAAQAYADTGDTATLAAAQAWADAGDATTLTAADAYADTGNATTLASASAYADGVLTTAQAYADAGDATTLTTADGRYAATGDVPELWTSDVIIPIGPFRHRTHLQDALDALENVRIAPGITVTLQLDAYTYTSHVPIEIDHPDGARIAIVGDPTDPANVVLSFPDSEGIHVADNGALGLLDGVTLQGSGTSSDGMHGVEVETGAMARLGDVILDDWGDTGVFVHSGGVVVTDEGASVEITGSYGQGAMVQNGGVLELHNANIAANQDQQVGAWGGSVVDLTDATVTGHIGPFESVRASSGSFVQGEGLTIDGGGNALYVENASAAFLDNATISDCSGYGALVYKSSSLTMLDTTIDSSGWGVLATTSSSIWAEGTDILSPTHSGYTAKLNASVLAQSSSTVDQAGDWSLEAHSGGQIDAPVLGGAVGDYGFTHAVESEFAYIEEP